MVRAVARTHPHPELGTTFALTPLAVSRKQRRRTARGKGMMTNLSCTWWAEKGRNSFNSDSNGSRVRKHMSTILVSGKQRTRDGAHGKPWNKQPGNEVKPTLPKRIRRLFLGSQSRERMCLLRDLCFEHGATSHLCTPVPMVLHSTESATDCEFSSASIASLMSCSNMSPRRAAL